MKKAFTFTMTFEAEIQETFDSREKSRPKRLQELLSQFLADERAVLDLYKIWLLGDLRLDEHHDTVAAGIDARHEDDILADVLARCSAAARDYYMDGLNQKDDRKLSELEDLFGQFGLLELTGASFEERQ